MNVILRVYIWKSSFVNVMFANIKYVLRNLCNGVYLFGVEDSILFTKSAFFNMFTESTF